MAEEFEESDVIFSDDTYVVLDYRDMKAQQQQLCITREARVSRKNSSNVKKIRRGKKKATKAVPIPGTAFRYVEFDDSEDGGGEVIPPHVILERRTEGEMSSFSVCSGIGRTLKGKDLSRVRNYVLRMTGFLEG